MFTVAVLDAVADAMGYDVEADDIAEAVRRCRGMDTEDMEEELEELTEEFDRCGGRGVDLADRIDLLRMVLAVRSVAEDRSA